MQITCDYARSYEIGQLAVMQAVERDVLGGDYGGTSWTTRSEAELMSTLLTLGAKTRLLELGAGSGWPGILLTELSGCRSGLVDIPLSGLRIATARAGRDGLARRCRAVAGDGARLPRPGARGRCPRRDRVGPRV